MARVVVVEATWDEDASVWVAISDAIGLATEAPTIEALQRKIPGMIQDLLEPDSDGQDLDVPFELCARSSNMVRVRSRAA